MTQKTVPEAMDMLADGTKADGYSGVGFNLVLADSKNNIGYQMMASIPLRKDRTPYVGNRVLDGSTTAQDWETGKNVPLEQLPRSLNPEKGYLVTANHRQTTDNAINDYGAIAMPTSRALRITEMIEGGIKAGKKFDLDDMAEIQLDVIDVFARELAP